MEKRQETGSSLHPDNNSLIDDGSSCEPGNSLADHTTALSKDASGTTSESLSTTQEMTCYLQLNDASVLTENADDGGQRIDLAKLLPDTETNKSASEICDDHFRHRLASVEIGVTGTSVENPTASAADNGVTVTDEFSVHVESSCDSGNSSADRTTTSSNTEDCHGTTSESLSTTQETARLLPSNDEARTEQNAQNSCQRVDLATVLPDTERSRSSSGISDDDGVQHRLVGLSVDGAVTGTDVGELSGSGTDKEITVTERSDAEDDNEQQQQSSSSELSTLSFDELRQLAAALIPMLDSMVPSPTNPSPDRRVTSVVEYMAPVSENGNDPYVERSITADSTHGLDVCVDDNEYADKNASSSTVEATPSVGVLTQQRRIIFTSPDDALASIQRTSSVVASEETHSPLGLPSNDEPLKLRLEERKPELVSAVSVAADAIDTGGTALQNSGLESIQDVEHSTRPNNSAEHAADESHGQFLRTTENSSDTYQNFRDNTQVTRQRTTDSPVSDTNITTTECGKSEAMPPVVEEQETAPADEQTKVLSKYQRIAVMMKLQRDMAVMQLEVSRLRDTMRSADSLLQQLMDSEFSDD